MAAAGDASDQRTGIFSRLLRVFLPPSRRLLEAPLVGTYPEPFANLSTWPLDGRPSSAYHQHRFPGGDLNLITEWFRANRRCVSICVSHWVRPRIRSSSHFLGLDELPDDKLDRKEPVLEQLASIRKASCLQHSCRLKWSSFKRCC